jgi:proline dehydrogenase
MLRTPLLYLSHAQWARSFITRFSLAQRTASRFVAGERAEDAIGVIRALNARRINATLDHLGESVTSEAEASRAAEDYVFVLGKINNSGSCSNVSIKLTQFGLALGEDICLRNVRRVLETARGLDNFVRIDMEGSAYVEATLRVFRTLHAEYDNVGLVLQAYLYRTEDDLRALVSEGARLRLCKGAYKEPADIAFPKKKDVDDNYERLAQVLLDHARDLPPLSHGGRYPPLPALATHDARLIAAAQTYAEKIGLPAAYYEFQMLYGIRRDLQDQLAAGGRTVRVYVPYGTEWYPYFMRRLAERPANLWFFMSNLVRH